MSRFRIVPVSIAALAIVSTTLACSIGSSARTPTPAPTPVLEQPTDVPLATDVAVATDVPLTLEAPTTDVPAATATIDAPKGVVILDKSAYTDEGGYYHVVGEVLNNTEAAITNVQLKVAIADSTGATLLKDSSDAPADTIDFSTMLYSLAPGQISPFDYYIYLDDKKPGTFDVTLTGQDATEVNQAKIDVQNTTLFVDSNGNLHFSGELVNLSDKPAKINSVAGAAFNEANTVMAANTTSTLSEYLEPAGDPAGLDRTPFTVYMDGPLTGVTQTRIFADADLDTPNTSYEVAIDVTNAYLDSYQAYHLVGTLTNNSSEILTANLVAGLYAADKTVLDAESTGAYLYLTPGQSIPFDLNGFGSVNFDADQIAKVSSYTVQVDPYWTFPASSEVVSLKTSGDQQTDNGDGSWTATGTITNASGKALSNESIMVAVTDAQGKLIAVGVDSVYPEGDSIAVGHKDTYSANIDLEPKADTSHLTFTTFVQGIVK